MSTSANLQSLAKAPKDRTVKMCGCKNFLLLLLSKVIILSLTGWNIVFLMEDLPTVERTSMLQTIFTFGLLLILNSYVFCRALLKCPGDLVPLLSWIVIYSVSWSINYGQQQGLMPIRSRAGEELITDWLNLDPVNGIWFSYASVWLMLLPTVITGCQSDRKRTAQENSPVIPMFYQQQTDRRSSNTYVPVPPPIYQQSVNPEFAYPH
jgi:hypothetical protein